MTDYDIIVVGAGFAGLSAAALAAARGARVLVLEARPALGGRATAFTDRVTGELVDNGQHLLLGCYHETFAFLRRVGADGHVRLQPALEVTFVDPAGARSTLSCPALPSPFHLLGGLFEWEALGFRDRLAALAMLRPLALARRELRRGDRIAASPGETVENWLIRNGQTARLREMLWEPLALAALNQPVAEAGAPPFARVLARMFGPDPRDAALAMPLRPLHQMYAEPARGFIEAHGGTVLAGRAAAVGFSGGRAAVAVAGDEFRAAAFVLAVPWFGLREAIRNEPAALAPIIDRAGRLGHSPIVTVNAWFDRPVLDVPFVGLPGRHVQWVFDKREAFGPAASHLSMVSSGAGGLVAHDNQGIIDLALAEVAAALPSVRAAGFRRASVVRERRATFSLAPGQPVRPGTRTPIDNLFLAGDWIDTGLPGTIESAVTSGHRAAEAALAAAAPHR